jgi:aspartate aminotransferase
VLVTNGGKHAVYNALTTLLDPGDEVLLPAPYWTTYPEPIALAGARAVVLPTDESTGFRVTVEQLDAACTEATKALLFVSPSNPTGVVYPPSEVRAIGEWALEKGIWVVTDEIYEHLTFGEHHFASMPALVPELAERCVVLNGVAKTYAMTGWRVGWMIGPSDLIAAATNFQSHVTSNVANVSQRAALAAVAGDLDAVAEMRAAFERRGRTIHRMLNEIPGITAIEPQGAFYAFPSMQGVLGKTIAGRKPATTLELAELILEEAKVAIVPGEAFGAPGYARLSFALSDDDLVEGVSRIGALLATAT